MPIQLVWGNGTPQDSGSVINIIAAHRQATRTVKRLNAEWMSADEAEALLLRRPLDVALMKETELRRRLVRAQVRNASDVKIKADYFRRLMGQEWYEIEPGEVRELLRSFATIKI